MHNENYEADVQPRDGEHVDRPRPSECLGQLVRHRHIEVNGRIVTIPSFQVRAGDVVSVRAKSVLRKEIKETMENRRRTEDQPWLEEDEKIRLTVFYIIVYNI